MRPIKVASLNAGRLFHKAPAATLDFLLHREWDVVVAQDIYRDIVESAEFRHRWSVRHFEAMTNHYKRGALREEVGVGIFTRLQVVSRSSHAYVNQLLPVLDLQGADVGADGCASARDLDLLCATESRLVLFVEILTDAIPLKIGTTHGPYRPGGKVDPELRTEMARFLDIVTTQPGDLVIAGDFNTARGGEIYQTFLRAGLKDCVPSSITNTIDWEMRGKKGPDLVVDGVYAKGDSLVVSNVRTHAAVSDHYGLSFDVEQKA